MTRLQEFVDRVTREMLRAYWTEPCDDLTLAATNARLVLEREARAFVTAAVNWQDERSAMDPTDEPNASDWLDLHLAEPASPPPPQREPAKPPGTVEEATDKAYCCPLEGPCPCACHLGPPKDRHLTSIPPTPVTTDE